MLAWGCACAIAGFFAAAGALYVRYERANPHNRIGYLDLALPTRWSERHRLQGEGLILLAQDKFKEGRFGEGFSLLRQGLSKNPADSAARLNLARIYLARGLRPQAEKLMADGLAFGYPGREFLTALFSLAADADRPEQWIALCRRAREQFDQLPEAEQVAGDSLWLNQETVRARVTAKLLDEVLNLLEERFAEDDPFRRETAILVYLEQKNVAAALALAERWAKDQPTDLSAVRLLIRCHRENGDFTSMDASFSRLRELAPNRPETLVYSLVQNYLGKRKTEAKAALDDVIFRFGADESIYPFLTTALVSSGFTAPLPELAKEMESRGMAPRPVLIAQLQVDLENHNWLAALATAKRIGAGSQPPLSAAQKGWLETMERLALACSDGGSGNQSTLVEAVADNPGALAVYTVVLDSLLASGRVETAAQVLALAEGPFPTSRSIVALRGKIQERRAELAAALPKPAAVDAATGEALSGLAPFTTAFDARVQARDPLRALELLSALRRAQPAWMIAAESRLDALELPVRARGDDTLRLQLLTRNALGRDRFAPNRMLLLAQTVFAEGYRGNALLMLNEILRREPAHSEALAQLLEWEPREVVSPDPASPAP
ncbi:MAG: hypothetical protein EAZ36_02365 [Verrucomicrobia bacterium]|nr:MAG: hypothetical protein EAZ36_02365 [Verrucomicrobiota bacterium]